MARVALWNEREDDIVRTLPLDEARKMLPHRSQDAVRCRRCFLKATSPQRKAWTRKEDGVLRRSRGKPAKALLRKLPGRSLTAVHLRRQFLGLQPRIAKAVERWTAADLNKLIKHYPAGASRQELLTMFPGRTYEQVIAFARYRKIKRGRVSMTGRPLIDEIRLRCKEDGVPIGRLCEQLGIPRPLLQGLSKRQDMNHIAAVSFFGGIFKIDWQDE